VSPRTLRLALLPAIACFALAALAPSAWGASKFHPRVKGALGLIPPVGSQDVASGALVPVTYHGGKVMGTTGPVTIHTIFWAPSGFSFSDSPGAGIPDYKSLIQQFFTDAAAASEPSTGTCNSSTCNMLTVLPQFGQETNATPPGVTPGQYNIAYNAGSANDSIDDTDPYPTSGQCASPNNIGTCVTDAQVQQEVDTIAATHGNARGLNNIWFVFLPPNVDECITPGICGTNAFGGYHSLSNINGDGVTIYSPIPDPVIETTNPPGGDPQGNPDAEVAVDVEGHEMVEAITDPEGIGWMDPNGFEVADKCEFGPQHGTPIGHAANGSPFNQVINGHKYWLQEMWSNADNGCVQTTARTDTRLPLPQVSLTQFGSTVSGNIGSATAGVGVQVSVQRNGADGSAVTVAQASTTTAGNGDWSLSIAPHAVGDDRDEIDVDYSGGGAPTPNHQVILTGNGGNPFTESGWTGWFDLDNGTFATNDAGLGGPSLSLGPCFQTGVLSETLNATPISDSATDFCSTQTDVARITTPATGAGDTETVSSNDNRAFSDPNLPTANPRGGLVDLSVPVGEADSVSQFVNPLPFFTPGGFPSCTADLEAQTVTCTGLVPGAGYTLTDGSADAGATADSGGTATASLAATRGDTVSLSNGGRVLTTLHVAHLKVQINGEQTVLAGGTCQASDYYGAPLSDYPTSAAAGVPSVFVGGAALTGTICPTSGDASGLPASPISQTDELSGGQTQTEVPDIENTSPLQGETVYGFFVALAESGLPGPHNTVVPTDSTTKVALSISRSAGGSPVFNAKNVDTPNGVLVPPLKPGTYKATWTLIDANGDTRTVTTRFIELPAIGPRGPQGPRGPRGRRGPAGPTPTVTCTLERHNVIKCTVTFRKARSTKGKLQVRLARGKALVALGHSKVNRGSAKLTLHMRRHATRGAWKMTVVLAQPHKPASTTTMKVRMK
jgi:hypothetical protein